MARAEKIVAGYWDGPHRNPRPFTGAGHKRFLKRKLRRLRRRAWSRLGEDAPVRVRDLTLGWSL